MKSIMIGDGTRRNQTLIANNKLNGNLVTYIQRQQLLILKLILTLECPSAVVTYRAIKKKNEVCQTEKGNQANLQKISLKIFPNIKISR